jgi:hypothetical protein
MQCQCQCESTGRIGSLTHLTAVHPRPCMLAHVRDVHRCLPDGCNEQSTRAPRHNLPTQCEACHTCDTASMVHCPGTQRRGGVRQDHACQYCTSTPDQRRCSVACRLGLSQIDKLDGHPVTGAASNTYVFHKLVRTVYTHRLSVMFAAPDCKPPSSSRSLAAAVSTRADAGGRRICAKSA